MFARINIFITLILVFVFAQSTHAAEITGFRKILTFGCHKVDSTCYMVLDGPVIAGAGPACSGNDIRWDSKNDPNGKHWLALVMLAKATNRRITLYVDSCYAGSAFPTFAYGALEE